VETFKIIFLKTFHIPDETLKWLVRFLRNCLHNLIRFEVIFVDCYELTDTGMEKLSQLTRYLLGLKELKIEFASQPYLTGQGLKRMAFEVGRNLKNFEKLSLILAKCYRLEDKDLDLLFQGMGNYFQTLKYLELNFDYSELITNKGIELIARKVSKHLKGLQSFGLSIVGCEQIDYLNREHISEDLSFIPEFVLKTKHML